LRDLLGTEKDKETNVLKKSGIYRLDCENCEKKYVGQTKRSLEVRVNEHLNEMDLPEEFISSAMALHAKKENHEIGNIHLLKEVNQKYLLDATESFFIKKEDNGNLTNRNLKGNLPSKLYELG
jgi:GIY-YIG catalytic domain